jgi:hypothetical protein
MYDINKNIWINNCKICNKEFESDTCSKLCCSDKCYKELLLREKEIKKKDKERKASIIIDKIIEYIKINNKYPTKTELFEIDGETMSLAKIIRIFFYKFENFYAILHKKYLEGCFKIIRNCIYCNKPFDASEYFNDDEFCSRECEVSYENKNKIQITDKLTNKIISINKNNKYIRTCVNCNSKFYDKSQSDFCSLDCEKNIVVPRLQKQLVLYGEKVALKCNTCKEYFITDKIEQNCDKCKPIIKENNINTANIQDFYKSQKLMYEIIKELLPSYLIEYNNFYKFLNGLQLDVYIPDLYIGFEYNGKQHYEYLEFFHKSKQDFIDAQKRDRKKAHLCRDNKIDLVVIKYDELINWRTVIYHINEIGRKDILNLILDGCCNYEIQDYIENNYNMQNYS